MLNAGNYISLEGPLGVDIMDAMAMEVPIVATDAGAFLICANGLLVDPGSAKALTDAICSLIQSPKFGRELGELAR